MAGNIEYREMMWFEQSPDLYAGEACDECRPRWYGYADGDKDGDFVEKIELTPDRFPPGTKVMVLIPCCPMCGVDAGMHQHQEECNFDWNEWAEGQYS